MKAILLFCVFLLLVSCGGRKEAVRSEAQEENSDVIEILRSDGGKFSENIDIIKERTRNIELKESRTDRNFAVRWQGGQYDGVMERFRTIGGNGIKLGALDNYPYFVLNADKITTARHDYTPIKEAKTILYRTYYFEGGRLKTVWDPDDNPYDEDWHLHYEYDEQGRLTRFYKTSNANVGETNEARYSYYWDEQNQTLRCYSVFTNGGYLVYEEQKTDTGYRLRIINSAGKEFSNHEVVLQDGRAVSLVNKFSYAIYTTLYSYDENGLLVEEAHKDLREPGKQDEYENNYVYNFTYENGRLKTRSVDYSKTRFRDNNIFVIEYFYDEHGNIAKTIRTDDDSGLTKENDIPIEYAE